MRKQPRRGTESLSLIPAKGATKARVCPCRGCGYWIDSETGLRDRPDKFAGKRDPSYRPLVAALAWSCDPLLATGAAFGNVNSRTPFLSVVEVREESTS